MFLLFWWGGKRTETIYVEKEIPITQIVHETDTLFVTAKPDTIYLEKQVFVKVEVPVEVKQEAVAQKETSENPTEKTKGVTLKETEELFDLIRTGEE